MSEFKPKIIINCAAFVGGISYGYKYPARMLSENSSMAINLYNLSLEHNVEKLINPISNCAYLVELTTYKEEQFFEGPPDKSVYIIMEFLKDYMYSLEIVSLMKIIFLQ